MNILGVWDGHDAGAALLVEGRLVAAANEERFTRRKLEYAFPVASIRACLSIAGIGPAEVEEVAGCTLEVSKALGRLMPTSRERFYLARRRQTQPSLWATLMHSAQFRAREWGPTWWSRLINQRGFERDLASVGLRKARIRLLDHHACHAAAAAYASPFASCVVVTIDGLGDGWSSTVYRLRDGRLTLVDRTPARHSAGVFFEHVTALLNMRPLEDEGKVMALADYAAPVPDEKNPLLSILTVEGLQFRTSTPGHALRRVLHRHHWSAPNEQFAYMAQRALERASVALVDHAVRATGESRVALAGGVVSNVKVNQAIRHLDAVDEMFVFPHMGDGGLACGAAIAAAVQAGQPPSISLDDLGFGPGYDDQVIQHALAESGLTFTQMADLPDAVSALLAEGRVVLWFEGRMEYGPRALGHRSILARPDRPDLRDRLNLILKRRVWYQPFCPSMLETEARMVLADYTGAPNRHMTMAYTVRPEWRSTLAGVLSVDGTCRPQIVPDEDPSPFGAVLRSLRAHLGCGVALNTSFNIHGTPLVCTPTQAIDVLKASGADWLAMGSFLVQGVEAARARATGMSRLPIAVPMDLMGRQAGDLAGTTAFASQYLEETAQLAALVDTKVIERTATTLAAVRARGGRLFFLGVGGGASHASHAVNDFRKLAGFEAYAPTDNVSELTARTNDEGWESVFATWLKGSRLHSRDAVFVFSVGGGSLERNISANLVSALKYAKQVGATVLGIVGKDGGFTAKVADACIVVPTINPSLLTAHTEAFQAVISHLLVFHPALQTTAAKWESTVDDERTRP